MNSNSKKTALVTGASSGIGQATAEALARAGFTVFGTSRKPDGAGPSQASMLPCDVTDEASVASTVLASSAGRTARGFRARHQVQQWHRAGRQPAGDGQQPQGHGRLDTASVPAGAPPRATTHAIA